MRRIPSVCAVVAAGLMTWGVAGGSGIAVAKGKAAAAASPAAGKVVNACGCYTNPAGGCLCAKTGKKETCACPGECEPKGCEEKRAKEMQKEIAAETKKAAAAEKKQRQSEAAKPK